MNEVLKDEIVETERMTDVLKMEVGVVRTPSAELAEWRTDRVIPE